MSNIISIRDSDFSARQIKLIRDTVARDLTPDEFDLFLAVAKRAGLDPFRKQISAIVFNKNAKDQSKRRVAYLTSIDGLRVIAARSRRYRPDDDEAEFEFDDAEKGPLNPTGLFKAKVKVFLRDEGLNGEWHRVPGVAYWHEYAPITEEWAEDERTGKRKPTGNFVFDEKSTWGRMPRVMLAKCAEAQALRRAFPEDLSNLYDSSEFDRSKAEDLNPSEMITVLETQDRLQRVGAYGAILFQMFPNSPLESIPRGQVFDRVIEVIEGFTLPAQIRWFTETNQRSMQEFWAHAKTDALELKKRIEAVRERLDAAEIAAQTQA